MNSNLCKNCSKASYIEEMEIILCRSAREERMDNHYSGLSTPEESDEVSAYICEKPHNPKYKNFLNKCSVFTNISFRDMANGLENIEINEKFEMPESCSYFLEHTVS